MHMNTGSGCKDKGCWAAFGGAGECVELGALSLNQLAQKFVFVFVFAFAFVLVFVLVFILVFVLVFVFVFVSLTFVLIF